MKPFPDQAQTLLMGFYAHRDLPLQINGRGPFPILGVRYRCIDFVQIQPVSTGKRPAVPSTNG